MSPIPTHPKLRWPLDLRLDKFGDQEILIVNCPLGIAKEPLILVAAVAPIVSSLDGNSTVEEIFRKFEPYGASQSLIEELISILQKKLFLNSSEFYAAEKKLRDDFSVATSRPAALAGMGYAATKSLLESEIQDYLKNSAEGLYKDPSKLICLVSPHIDYRRGGSCYGRTFQALRSSEHELYVLIGTAHQYSQHLFHLTTKDFENPLGHLACDRDLINGVAKNYGISRSFADEILHRKEHSLELQVPFLSFLNKGAKIAPILVGGFHHILHKDREPSEYEPYESFAASLTEQLKQRKYQGQSICFIAGVDMAHVGVHFGDSRPLSNEFLENIRVRDEQYLAAVESRNKRELWNHIAEDGDARRICGWPTLYLILDVMDRLNLSTSSIRFDYQQAVDLKMDCAVTFAGIGIYEH